MLIQALPFLPIIALAGLWVAGRLAFRMEG